MQRAFFLVAPAYLRRAIVTGYYMPRSPRPSRYGRGVEEERDLHAKGERLSSDCSDFPGLLDYYG